MVFLATAGKLHGFQEGRPKCGGSSRTCPIALSISDTFLCFDCHGPGALPAGHRSPGLLAFILPLSRHGSERNGNKAGARGPL